MNLPKNRDELRRRWAAGEPFVFFLFYGHKPPIEGVDASCLSQWFERTFEIDGIKYLTAEHWMMAEKARLFNDQPILDEILASPNPRAAKALGRKVRNFDDDVWNEHKFDIVKRGNLVKFQQHDDLKQFLLATADFKPREFLGAVAESQKTYRIASTSHAPAGEQLKVFPADVEKQDAPSESAPQPSEKQSNVILVEAAGRDTIWGIGLGENNPQAQDPMEWRGLNLLGFALTEAREELQ